MMPGGLPTVTPLQFAFLNELSTGIKTGKYLRERLRQYGLYKSRIAFYRLVRRLKLAGQITARRIPREKGEYRGAQCVYTLTKAGWDELIGTWEFYADESDAFEPQQQWRPLRSREGWRS